MGEYAYWMVFVNWPCLLIYTSVIASHMIVILSKLEYCVVAIVCNQSVS